MRKYQDEVEKIRLTKPELYSPVNEWAGMQPAQAWMQGTEAGEKLAPLHYTPYTDVEGEVDKRAYQFRKDNKRQKVKLNNPNDPATIEVDVDRLSNAQIANIIKGTMTQNERDQFAINAKYLQASSPDLFNEEAVGKWTARRSETLQNNVTVLENRLKNEENTMPGYEK